MKSYVPARPAGVAQPLSRPVYLVGPRYQQHAGVSGYDGFSRFVGTHLRPPVTERWPERWRAVAYLERMLERRSKPSYSLSTARIEWHAARHMVRHPGALYHVLYGETDVWSLGSIGRRVGSPVIASFHDGDDVLRDLGISERLLSTLSGIICLGHCQRSYFDRLVPAERIFVVPHGVDTDFFTPAPIRAREKVCVTVGGHTRDYATLEEAIDLVHAQDPDVRFVAVGSHIGIKGKPLTHPRVTYLSGISDEALRSVYRSASLAVFSFAFAVANNSVLEAMACGLPIVATDVGGVPEYVTPGCGHLYAPLDARGLAEAMLSLLRTPDMADQYGITARQQAEEFRFSRVAEQLSEVYAAVQSLGPRS